MKWLTEETNSFGELHSRYWKVLPGLLMGNIKIL